MKEKDIAYNNSFKNKAVRLSHKSDCIEKLEKQLEVYFELLSKWQNDFSKIGEEENFSTEEERIFFLEKKIILLDLKFEILKNGRFYISQKKPMLFDFIKRNEKKYSLRQLCSVFQVNRSTYRTWRKQLVSEKEKRRILVKSEITSIFFESKQRYGHKRITMELKNKGYTISLSTVVEYMKDLKLKVHFKKNKYQLKK